MQVDQSMSVEELKSFYIGIQIANKVLEDIKNGIPYKPVDPYYTGLNLWKE